MEFYSAGVIGDDEIFLDDQVVLIVADWQEGSRVQVPLGYNDNVADLVLLRGNGAGKEKDKLKFEKAGRDIIIEERLPEGSEVVVGYTYESSYEPTRPFEYDEQGIAITEDVLRIGSYTVNVVDTHSLSMEVISKYYNKPDNKFTNLIVGSTKVGEVVGYTGDIQLPFAHKADVATMRLYTSSYLGCTISGISWAGQKHTTSSRI